MYTYKAKLISVVDADTLDAFIDLGFQLTIRQRIRLYQTKPIPEKRDESIEALKGRLSGQFIVQTIFNRKNKTGRIFGILYETENEKSINAQMVEDGLLEKFEQVA